MTIEVNYNIQNWVELIINICNAVATAAAVIVALYANKKSNEQLLSALRIQEQSKNVDLFDRRMRSFESIEKEEIISTTELALLFTKEIMDEYFLYREQLQKKKTLN